jgi:transaldolase
VQVLEDEGVEKFAASWLELLDGVKKSLEAAAKGSSSPSDAASK